MKLKDNTILITGGSSGIGLELARVLLKKENKVIICGSSQEKLEKAKQTLPEIHVFSCDLSKQSERNKLFNWVLDNHPDCNILINNAAIVHHTDFRSDEEMIDKAEQEIQINLMAPIALSKLFLPLLEKNNTPKMINITTGLVYAPKAAYPIYNATKAALHSFTQVIRHQLKDIPIDIIEVFFPAVNTPWHKGNPPKIAISPSKAVGEMVKKLEKGQHEIRVGKVKLLHIVSRIAPTFAMKQVNKL